MKSLLKNKISVIVVALCSIGWGNIVKAQVFPLVLADTVTVFGPYQEMVVKGQLLKVRTKLNRHFGTTCQFEIEITNKGSKQLNATAGLVSVNSFQIYEVNSATISLKPNYYAVYKLEIRECLKKKVKNAILSCMACNPRLGFLQ